MAPSPRESHGDPKVPEWGWRGWYQDCFILTVVPMASSVAISRVMLPFWGEPWPPGLRPLGEDTG